MEVQLNYMMGPDTITSLEQGPKSVENVNEWKEQILQKIKIHWNTLFKEVINCKPPVHMDPMADKKKSILKAKNNLINYRNSFVQKLLERP